MIVRWVGIDEAGYGPNLGPMVMTAVVAEGPDDRVPNPWADLAATVARAGGDPDRLWIDDSKALYRGGIGRDRLDAACLAALARTGGEPPRTLGGLLAAVRAGTLADAELAHWLDPDDDPDWPAPETHALLDRTGALRAFEAASWRLVGVRSVVIGPTRFNAGLAESSSKARVHFAAFADLIGTLWDRAADGAVTRVHSDKHGGRHFYHEPLVTAFPEAWIDRGPEGPALSGYTLRDPSRRLELSILPRADRENGLVALASIVSKAVREAWMDAFNAHWTRRIPDLKPTAGYPGDATRFRSAIEADCLARGLPPEVWWRLK